MLAPLDLSHMKIDPRMTVSYIYDVPRGPQKLNEAYWADLYLLCFSIFLGSASLVRLALQSSVHKIQWIDDCSRHAFSSFGIR